MSDERMITWAHRTLSYGSAGVAAYWSGLWTFQPSWSPNWKLYGMMTLVGFTSALGAHLRGWLKGYEFHKSQTGEIPCQKY